MISEFKLRAGYIVALSLLVGACASKPKVETPAAPPVAATEAGSESGEPSIDVEGLARKLNLTRPVEVLGYQEAGFNSCDVGYGFSSSKNCHRMTLAVIHLRLQCRDTEGTISTALGAEDLRPISGQGVRWTLAGGDGVAQSDGEGYVEIRSIFPKSPRTQRLRIAVGLQFLYVRANEVSRIVTPRPWCHPDEK